VTYGILKSIILLLIFLLFEQQVKSISKNMVNTNFKVLLTTYGALCSGRSEFLAAGLQKGVSGLKFVFLDQISKRPCQPDMSLIFILSMSLYSDGYCTKPDVGCSIRVMKYCSIN
jgi:hypothetical protein